MDPKDLLYVLDYTLKAIPNNPKIIEMVTSVFIKGERKWRWGEGLSAAWAVSSPTFLNTLRRISGSLPELKDEWAKFTLEMAEDRQPASSLISKLIEDPSFSTLMVNHKDDMQRLIGALMPSLIEQSLKSQSSGLQASVPAVVLPLISQLIEDTSQDPASTIRAVGKIFGARTLGREGTENATSIEEAVAAGAKFSAVQVKAILDILPTGSGPVLSKLLSDNRADIAALVSKQIPSMVDGSFKYVGDLAESKGWDSTAANKAMIPAWQKLLYGVKPRFLQDTLEPIVKLTGLILANTSDEQLKKVASGDIPTLLQMLCSPEVSEFISRDLAEALGSPDLVQQKIERMPTKGKDSARQEASRAMIANVAKVFFNADLPPKFVDNIIPILPTVLPLVAKAAGTVLHPNVGLERFYTAYTSSPLNIREIVATLPNITEALAPILKEDLPQAFMSQQEPITKLLEQATALPQLKGYFGEKSDIPTFIANAAPTLLEVTAKILPHAADLIDIAMKDQGIQAVLPELFKQAGSDQTPPASNMFNAISTFMESNAAKPSLTSIGKELVEHSEKLGEVLDHFLHDTEIGRKYNVDGARLLNAAGNNLHTLATLAKSYSERKYGKMIVTAVKLLGDKNVRALIFKALFSKKSKSQTATRTESIRPSNTPPVPKSQRSSRGP